MNKSDFLRINNRSAFDYSILVIGEVVEVPLNGREPLTAQKTLLCHAKRKGWNVTTRIDNGKVYALREA